MTDKRAAVPLTYRVVLVAGDGTEWQWPVMDSYFKRRMAKIEKEMLEAIREHDLSYEFSMKDKDPEDRFRTCRFCGESSPPGKTYHRVGCTAPREQQ